MFIILWETCIPDTWPMDDESVDPFYPKGVSFLAQSPQMHSHEGLVPFLQLLEP